MHDKPLVTEVYTYLALGTIIISTKWSESLQLEEIQYWILLFLPLGSSKLDTDTPLFFSKNPVLALIEHTLIDNNACSWLNEFGVDNS